MIAIVMEAAARSAVLILLVWLTLAVLRPQNPHVHKALWTIVVVASLAMPLLIRVHVAPPVAAPLLEWTLGPRGAPLTHALGLRPLGALVDLLLVPSVLLLWRCARGWRRLWRIRCEGRRLTGPWTAEGLDVRVSAGIVSPATFGRTILLPKECTSWSTSKLVAVMAHERAHVLHRDCYVLWLARLAVCLFWFNPLAWWVERRLAALAEQTSDEAAVETLGSRLGYAEILLGFGLARSSEPAAAMASSNLAVRVERLLSGLTLSPALKRRQLALLVVAALPVIAAAAAPLQFTPASAADNGQVSYSSTPRVVSWGRLDEFYPPQARKKDIEGMVELAITLDREGRPTDTQILTEDPLEMGFGAAASAAVHAMKYSNPTAHPVTFTLRVRFALSHAPPD
jgi:TonB family protein